jgi:hypothetical protein
VPDSELPTIEPSLEKSDLGLLRTGASGLPMFFLRHDGELLGRAPIAEGNRTADPKPFAFRSGDLVSDPFADDLALELGKGEQHVEGEPPRARGRVEGLHHR